jgi:hypothetical protein
MPRAAKPPAEDEQEPLIAAEDAIGPDARERVPWAGLLAAEPELRDATYTRAEWQELLDAYQRSERI